jgi:hypothetical protein
MTTARIAGEWIAWSRACLDCSGAEFRRGPQGGLSINIECTGCGARFNIGDLRAVVLIQRIANNGPWPDRGRYVPPAPRYEKQAPP